MILSDSQKYDIFRMRDINHVGALFMGVKTTGIFCRPGCPARTPKPENCDFFDRAETAVSAGYRPCKRCHPMHLPGEATKLIKQLINLVESEPEKKWRERDLAAIGIDPSTARRHFKKRFGMTFSTYVRQRNLARARKELSSGDSVINAQLGAGFDSPSGFRAAYAKTFGAPPNRKGDSPLYIAWIDTLIGPMISICDESQLFLTEFTVRKNLEGQITKLSKSYQRPILPGRTAISDITETQINAYFAGRLKEFDLPIVTTGTAFQDQVWDTLQTIPYGQTWSYSKLADIVGNAKAVRAVASSNARNGLAIIIPCHRVISKGGSLGGYAGGLNKKQWLLDHEARFS